MLQAPLKVSFIAFANPTPVMECMSYREYIPFVGELLTAHGITFRVVSKNYDHDNEHLTIYLEKQ